MKVKMLNVIILCLSISTIVLISYFLYEGKINGNHFTFLFLGIILASLALYGFDRLKEIDFMNLKLILKDLKEVQKDIYAKAETVKTMGEEIAELTAFNVTSIGRFASDDLDEKMLEARDRIKEILQKIGSDKAKVERISTQIENMVLRDLKRKVESEVAQITHTIQTNGKQINRDKIHNKVKELLEDYDRSSLVDYLKEQEIYSEAFSPLLNRLDKFIKDKKL